MEQAKYPVVVRTAGATITGVDVLDASTGTPGKRDYVHKNVAHKQLDAAVDPETSHKVTFDVSFKGQSLDAMRPLFDIQLSYFDPRKNADCALALKHRFFYPELGWKKSEEQRKEAEQAFEKLQGSSVPTEK